MATILLVDDDVDLVDMYRLVLAHRGHNVLCAYSAEEARKVLATARPDAAVLDVMMESETAGLDLAREVHGALPGCVMVMLSGVHEATGLPFRLEPDETWLPVARFIDKPAAPAALADEIERLLGG